MRHTIWSSLPGLSGPDLKGKLSRAEDRGWDGRRQGNPARRGSFLAPASYTGGHESGRRNEMPGPTEWLIVGAVVLLLFGAKKLPDLARSLGRSSSEFKKGIREGGEEDESEGATPGTPASTTEASTETAEKKAE
jgi:sec-independent protein translocase protein TatA